MSTGSVNESPRIAWVREHAAELIALAASCGGTRLCLCGSVSRNEDKVGSDIDLYVWDFDAGVPGTMEELEAHQRATALVKAIRALSPYPVDVRGIPGWCLDAPHEASMRQDAIELSSLVG